MNEPLNCFCGQIISSMRLRSKFHDQDSCVDMPSKGYLIVLSVPCDIRKGSLEETFKMNKFLMKEPIIFCKYYDSEGNTQLPLQSDHFVNPTV